MKILVINCGSSSLKYQLMDMSDLSVLCKGVIERIGMTINGGEKNVSVKVNGQKFEYDKEVHSVRERAQGDRLYERD